MNTRFENHINRPSDWYWSGLIPILLVSVFATGCATSAPAQSDDALFERYEVVTDVATKRQTVLFGFFLDGDTAELAVVHGENYAHRRLEMYGLVGSAWQPKLSAKLKPGVLFADIANIGGRDRLIMYRRGSLYWFDPDSATERVLLEVDMQFKKTDAGAVPVIDISRDLNHDGRDDLLMPQVDGFWVSLQNRDGSFTDALKLGPPEPFRDETVGNMDPGDGPSDPTRTYGEAGITVSTLPLYMRRVYEMDYNLDGRSDLVFWNEDHFDVYLQRENGLFAEVASRFDTDVAFDSDGTYSYLYEFKDQGATGAIFGLKKKSRRTVLHSIRDLSGDGVADLVTLTLSGRSFIKQKSVYRVHAGTRTPAGVVFERDARTTINPRGKGGAMQPWGYASQLFQDFDADGQTDILFQEVNVGVSGMSRALVGNSVPINLEFYRGESGVYPASPTVRRKIKRFAPFAGLGNVFFPAVLLGDINGDGRSDLLIGHGPQELHVFPGEPEPELFARKPLKVAVALPPDERNIWLADLNRDAKADLVVQLGPTGHAPGTPHRIITLIAR